MQYEIDQSGKIEQTDKDTILVIANGKKVALFLSKSDKRKLELKFRSKRIFHHWKYSVFAVLLAILFTKTSPDSGILVDREYFGHEDLIEELLGRYLKRLGYVRRVYYVFGLVGKLSPAHTFAARVARRKTRYTYKVSLEEIEKLIFESKEKDRRLDRSNRRST